MLEIEQAAIWSEGDTLIDYINTWNTYDQESSAKKSCFDSHVEVDGNWKSRSKEAPLPQRSNEYASFL